MSVELATRITAIESRLQELKSIGTPGNFNGGAIPFGGPNSGKLTSDPANLYWDRINYRLGISNSLPDSKLRIDFSGGSNIGQRIVLANASADTMFQLLNSDNTIGSSSYYVLVGRQDRADFQIRGDGYIFGRGPVLLGTVAPFVPTKTQLHVYSATYHGLRVANATGGGAIVQAPLTTNATFARAWFGHNAMWNDADSLWYIDNIGANDAQGIFIANGGPMEFIMHASTGGSARTMNMATFRGGVQMTITNTGLVNLNGGGPFQISGVQILTTRQTGWGTPTATLSRTAITNADTLAQTISHLAALVTDLRTHGIIGT